MNRYAVQLISRGAVNKIGNMLYDYGNSVWLASMGAIGQTVLGMYQISELVTSILVNPFGGVISDRFSRRKILMVADLVCGILCLAISFIRNDSWMIGALIGANIVQAIAFAFSRPANKAIITELVEKDELVLYNSRLELVMQVVSVSSPVLSFLVLQFASLRITLVLDAFSFFLAFGLVALLPKKEDKTLGEKKLTFKVICADIKEGVHYIVKQREIFFLLVMASSVNFFFAAFNYLLPFSNQLYGVQGAYATILTMGAIGSIVGALLASKIKASMEMLLFLLALTGLGVMIMGFTLPSYLTFSGNFICELFMTIFNIHFFTQVQTKVEGEYLGRVLSSIYTLAILFMPIATGLMTFLPSVHLYSFLIIGLGVVVLSFLALGYVRTHFEKLI
ncbi:MULTISPECIES: MFS transporter [Streptococcus]|uniref:MFS transporter n=2 Tax=Streptococcus TaxID=1301 RepID=A0ABX9PAH0_9STRE|nr:MFS transporter [Streptococcus pseudopneumoniae]RJQ63730.1 MFS transporter [Streptococcus pseudopneumoniae]RJY10785.1 MFS transporter [Streptococcus pseudopneumoniae]BDT64636.1 MFS transporter [Streptococcus sp. SP4011]